VTFGLMIIPGAYSKQQDIDGIAIHHLLLKNMNKTAKNASPRIVTWQNQEKSRGFGSKWSNYEFLPG
jgi:hypothetical protein